jgi:large subunit ribosomal protein L22
MESSAKLTDYRQSPRKVRLVANLIRGKAAPEALSILSMLPKRAALPMEKLLRSAIANAKGDKLGTGLFVSTISVDKGTVLKRFMPRARGSAAPIHKHSSHVNISLSSVSPKKGKAPKAKKTSVKEVKEVKEALAATA